MIHSRSLCLLLAVGLALSLAIQPASAKKKKKAQVENADDLLIVDCALPGRIRQLGRNINYTAQGRRIRTSAVDCRIRGGEYTSYDRSSYASSLEFWLPGANKGEAEAQAYVGQLYEKGIDGPADYELAALWYRKAAEQDYARAQVNLAHLYEQGLGVEEDAERARYWYARARGLSEDEIHDARSQAEELRQELELLEQKMKRLESEFEAARSRLQQAEDRAEELRQQLEEARESSASGAAAGDRVERLEAELRQQELEVAARAEAERQRKEEFARLRREMAATRARNRASTRSTVAAPTIEIIRPDVLTTRGPALVPVPSGATRMQIRGRVTAPAGIRELTVDDRALAVDPKGVFSATVPIVDDQRQIRFEVTDRVGRDARALLVLLPEGSDVTQPPPTGGASGPAPTPSPAVAVGNYHALIIGIADYRNLTDLETAERDVDEIEAMLASKYGFETTVLKNPSRLAMLSALNGLSENLGPEAHLLIYYAGHGDIEPADQKGYWIPADAEPGNRRSWIPNEAISDILDLIPAKRILVVSDSCYSGTLTHSGLARTEPPADDGRQAPAGRRSRTVLTSGGLEPVLDGSVDGGGHSLFAGAFLRVLGLSDETLSGDQLHRAVASRVVVRADELGVDQVPQYAPIRFSGHEAGDFVLVPRRTRQSALR